MEGKPQMPEKIPDQAYLKKEQFLYESMLQHHLAELAFPGSAEPLMEWAEDTEGYSSRFREWIDDPRNHATRIDLSDRAALHALLEKIQKPPQLH